MTGAHSKAKKMRKTNLQLMIYSSSEIAGDG